MQTGFSPDCRNAILFLTGLLAGAQNLYAQRVIYVNHASEGVNDGTSWADAYLDLQDALDDAATRGGCPCEVWVAAGRYKPDRGTGDRYRTFRLADGVTLLGGFAGTEHTCDERDVEANEVLLDGDLGDDDLPEPNTGDTCCWVPETGVGHCEDEDCVARVAWFEDLCAVVWARVCAVYAQAVCCDRCRPSRCENSTNVVTVDGQGTRAVLDGVTVANGEANEFFAFDGYGFYGGGLYMGIIPNCCAGPVEVRNSVFRDHGAYSGAALYVDAGDVVLADSTFENNYSYNGSSGVSILGFAEGDISNCVFADNVGAGLYYQGVQRVIRDSTFSGNTRSGLRIMHWGAPLVWGCRFERNRGYSGGAVQYDGLSSLGVQVVGSTFVGNSARSFGGCSYAGALGAGMGFVNCLFTGNYAYDPSPTAMGGNATLDSGGFALNSVFYRNWAEGGGGGPTTNIIANSIMWGNTAASDSVQQQQFYIFPEANETSNRYNCIEGWDGTIGGIGNVALEPGFVDPAGPDGISGTGDEDFHLAPDSPLINLGDPAPPLAPYLDFDGHARKICGPIDMGAYEFGIGDYNCDRIVELDDYVGFPECLTGPVPAAPYPSACAAYDFATEVAEDVDLLDFAGFQNAAFDDAP